MSAVLFSLGIAGDQWPVGPGSRSGVPEDVDPVIDLFLELSFVDEAVDLAGMAHIRHAETQYDQLLQRNWDRHDARASIAEEVRRIRAKWGRSE